jgi:Lipoprotein LpqB beta-propeller domain/Sporulation and spore germination
VASQRRPPAASACPPETSARPPAASARPHVASACPPETSARLPAASARPHVASRARLGGLRRMCVLAAAVVAAASVAGCVGMPSNGPAAQTSASSQSTSPAVNLIGPFPSGPQPGASPSQIVQGFLIAGASYPTYTIADDYLLGSAAKTWNPGFAVTVFSNLVPNPATSPKAGRNGVQQASVDVTGQVQASFNGSGQYYVSAQSQGQGQAAGRFAFNLVKVNGQWRITNPPDYRMLTAEDFPLFYKAQDLYFVDPQDPLLVPDSVFVPLSATVQQLLDNLVTALVQGPTTPWLVGATQTELPAKTKLQGVVINGSNVTVSLGGHVARTDPKLQLFAAQLVWTLTASPAVSPASAPDVQSVVLNVDGQPWAPRAAPCPGGRSPGEFQTQAAYACYNPYPSSPASFYYVEDGQSWSRCGSQVLGTQGSVGSAVPLVGRTGAFASQGCGVAGSVREGSAVPPPAQPPSLPALTMTAVSPDGKYVAVVTAAKGDLYVGPLSGQPASLLKSPRLTGGDITALSWDRNDNLWVAQGGNIVMLPSTGKGQVQADFAGNVSDLSVAPDGVRIAFIAQIGNQPTGVYLAAIGGGPPTADQLASPGAHLAIRTYASVAPNVTDPASVAWYDADDLLVLNDAPGGNTLYEAPVDGQPAQLQVIPSDATSITSDGRANVLVAGLAGGNLSVSTSLEGPWYPLGDPGQYPAYPG